MRHTSPSRYLIAALFSAILALPIALQAQSLQDFHDLNPEEKRAYWDSMSEQEREAKRTEWRAERDAMSADERAAMHAERMARREEMRSHWNSMSEAEREALRAERHARHEERRAAWDALSDEEKQAKREAMRAHREERRARWESMSPEERAAMRERHGGRERERQCRRRDAGEDHVRRGRGAGRRPHDLVELRQQFPGAPGKGEGRLARAALRLGAWRRRFHAIAPTLMSWESGSAVLPLMPGRHRSLLALSLLSVAAMSFSHGGALIGAHRFPHRPTLFTVRAHGVMSRLLLVVG